jgi:exonuclease VII small subunit
MLREALSRHRTVVHQLDTQRQRLEEIDNAWNEGAAQRQT